MPRIRTIKPEFCQSEKIGKLSRDARLLFVLLWTFVDDHGRCRGSSRLLAANLYPYDDDVHDLIDAWLGELETGNHIRRYIIDGTTYLEVVNWGKHQRIDNAGKSHIPEFSPQFAADRGESPLYLGPSTLDLGPRTISPSLRDADGEKVSRETKKEPSPEFLEFWKFYPKREGSNPREPARKKFEQLRKSGVPPAQLIAAVKGYAAEQQNLGKIGTSFIAQAVTWLNQRRDLDYAHPVTTGPPPGLTPEQLRDWTWAKIEASDAKNANGNSEGGNLLEAGDGIRDGALGQSEESDVVRDHARNA